MTIWKYARAQWDRTTAGALFAFGALALVVGWIGVSKEALTALQIPYILSGGLGGIFLLGLGAVFWLSADMRDEWRKLDALERAVGDREPEAERDQEWLDESPGPVASDAATAADAAPPVLNDRTRAARRRPVRAS